MEIQAIQNRIYEIRGQNGMLVYDLAELYEVETRTLKQAVRRNADRFPEDVMFELTQEEADNLRSQFVISRTGWGWRRLKSFAFTDRVWPCYRLY